eukprot:145323-Prorocentrum_minimum.AAC.1
MTDQSDTGSSGIADNTRHFALYFVVLLEREGTLVRNTRAWLPSRVYSAFLDTIGSRLVHAPAAGSAAEEERSTKAAMRR